MNQQNTRETLDEQQAEQQGDQVVPDQQEIRFLGDLQRLVVKPGDCFVLTVPGTLSASVAARIQAIWKERGPQGKLLILEEGTKLGVFGHEDGE